MFSQAQGGQLRSAVGVMAKHMEDVLEMESDDSDEDSCSDADSNEEESTSLPQQETESVAQSGIQVKRSEISECEAKQ